MNIGSDVVQQTLVMSSVVFMSSFLAGKKDMEFSHDFNNRDYLPMIGAYALLLLLVLDRVLSRPNGLILVSVFSFYMCPLYRNRKDSLTKDV
jgi:Ca2+/Na+ antiporter